MLSTVSKKLSKGLKRLLNILEIKYISFNFDPKPETENMKFCIELNGSERTKKFMDKVNPKNLTKFTRYQIWKKYGICPTNITYDQRKKILNGDIDPFSFY